MGDSTESSGTDSTTELKSNDSKDVEIENKLENKEGNENVNTEEKTSINSNTAISSEDNKNGYMDSSNITYEGDKCIYIDPSNKSRYIWNEEKKEWVAEQSQQPDPTTGNSDYHFDGSTYTYKDKNTNVEYKWDVSKNSWLSLSADDKMETDDKIKEPAKTEQTTSSNTAAGKNHPKSQYCPETDTYTYTDPSDNTVYMWDRHKSAWFPKVDDDFMAQYQMNYGFVDPNADSSEDKKVTEEKEEVKNDEGKGEKRKAQPQPPTWFEIDESSNTKVYVSNLPLDITEKEFVDLMQKCGLVMKDVETNKMKVKLYTEKGTSHLKGDGLCTYIKKESVDLALNLLDGYELKGKKLKVERAKFTMKGDSYDPSLKPKKRKKKELEKIKKMQEKLFDWRPDKLRGERSRNESVVIVKNLFDPAIFDKDVKLILEFQQELREECLKCGDLKRVIIYDKHPEGVAQVNFKLPEAADACVQLLNGRWYNKRKITAETWDGKTKYKINETEEERKKRLANWDQFLHTGSESKPDNKNNDTAADVKSDTNQASDTDNGKTNNKNTDVVSQKNTDNENNSVSCSGSDDKKVIDRDSDQDTKSIDSEYSTEDEEDLK